MSSLNVYSRSRKFQDAGKNIVGDSSPPPNDNYRSSSNYRVSIQPNQEGGSYHHRQKTDFSLDIQPKMKSVNYNDGSNGYRNSSNGRNSTNPNRNSQNISFDNHQGSLLPPISQNPRQSVDKYNLKSNRMTTNDSHPLRSECDQYQNLMPCQKQQHKKECNICNSPSPNRNSNHQPGAAAKNYKEKILQEEQQIFQQLEQIRSKMSNSHNNKKIATPVYPEKHKYRETHRVPVPLKLNGLEHQSATVNILPQQNSSSRREYQNSILSETPVVDSSTARANSNYEWGAMRAFSQASSPNRVLQSLNTLPGSPIETSNHHNHRKNSSNYSKTVYGHNQKVANLNDSQTNLGYNVNYPHSKTVYNNNSPTKSQINPETSNSIDTLKGTLKNRRPSLQRKNPSILLETQRKMPYPTSHTHQNIKQCSDNGPSDTGIDVKKIKTSRQNCLNLLDNLQQLVQSKKNLSYTTQEFYKPQ